MIVTNEILKKQFEAKFNGSNVALATSGTTEALKSLLKGDINLAAIGRALTEPEKAQGLTETVLSREKIAIVIGSGNPFKGSLTFEQFAKMLRGEITNWSQVGGTPSAIRFIDRPESSDTRQSLSRYPVFQSAPFVNGGNTTRTATDDTAEVVQALGKDGIGYAIVSQAINRSDVQIVPMHNTLPTDPRYPYSQPRNYVYKQGETAPGVLGFLGFATSVAGQAALQAAIPGSSANPATGIAPNPGTATNSGTATSPPATLPNATQSPAVGVTGNSATGNSVTGNSATGNSATGTSSAASSDVAQAPETNARAEESSGFPWWLWLIPLLGIPLLFWWLRSRGTDVAPSATPTPPTSTPPTLTPPTGTPPTGTSAAGTPAASTALDGTLGADVGAPIAGETDAILPTTTTLGTPSAGTIAAITGAGAAAGLAGAALSRDSATEDVEPADVWADEPAIATPDVAAPDVAAAMPAIAATGESPTMTILTGDIPTMGAGIAPGIGLSGGVLPAVGAVAGLAAVGVAASQQNRVALTPEGNNFNVQWDVPQADREVAKQQGGQRFQLRTYDVTDLDLDFQPPHSVQQYDIDEQTQRYVVPIPQGDRDYVAEVGYATEDDRWLKLYRSQPMRTPRVETPVMPEVADPYAGSGATLPVVGAVAGLAAVGAALNQNRVNITTQAGNRAKVEWEVSEAAKETLKQQGGSRFQVRTYDATDIDLDAQHAHSFEQYDCDEQAQSQEVPTPLRDRDYVAEVGYLTEDDRWLKLARSQPMRTPRVSVPVMPEIADPNADSGTIAAVTQTQCAIEELVVHSQRHCFGWEGNRLEQLQATAATQTLEPGTYILRIKQGTFSYQPDTAGEAVVLLWIHGGKVVNQKTNVPVSATWSTLNGYEETLNLAVLEVSTLAAFFLDTYPEDNQAELTLSVIQLPSA
jgi:ABC-type phosphate transport system substrate-binding protein